MKVLICDACNRFKSWIYTKNYGEVKKDGEICTNDTKERR